VEHRSSYESWLDVATTGPDELEAMRAYCRQFRRRPWVTAVVVVNRRDELWLRATLASLRAQAYDRVRLRLLCPPEPPFYLDDLVAEHSDAHRFEVRVADPGDSGWWAGEGVGLGDYLTAIEHGDELAPQAIFRAVESLQAAPAAVIYSDEDRIDEFGRHRRPRFKGPWSPYMSVPLGRMCMIEGRVLDAATTETTGDEPGLLSAIADRGGRIAHLPGVLYHQRELSHDPLARPVGTTAAPRRVPAAAARARAEVSVIVHGSQARLGAPVLGDLERALGGDLHEVLFAPTDGAGGVSPAEAANRAAAAAGGAELLFVDGSVRVAERSRPGWPAEMVAYARRPDVGVVAGRVLGPDGALLQAGMAAELPVLGGVPRPLLADETCSPPAVSATLAIVERRLFERFGGFAAAKLPDAWFDIDLALRLSSAGHRCVCTPAVTIARGSATAQPDGAGLAAIRAQWALQLRSMRYYRSEPIAVDQLRSEPDNELIAWSLAVPPPDLAPAAAPVSR
jgi:O-antigen biosynthesis protein